MKKHIKYTVVALLGASALTMGSAHAFGGHHGGPFGMGFKGCHKHFWNNDDCDTQMKERMDKMKQKLEITDGQLPAWEQFTAVVSEEALKNYEHRQQMKQQFEKAEVSGDSSFRDSMIDTRIEMMENGLQSMKRISQAYKDLSLVLTDEQKVLIQKKMHSRHGWHR